MLTGTDTPVGLSDSDKSTIAQALRNHVVERGFRSVSLLDGDLVRRNLSAGLTFSPADRETSIIGIGWMARRNELDNFTGITAPYETPHEIVGFLSARGHLEPTSPTQVTR